MKNGILNILKNVKKDIEKLIERDIDSENDVKEELADPTDLEKYIKELERLSKILNDLANQINKSTKKENFKGQSF